MAAVNKVILIGNLGRDPEVRYTASGTAVANFTLATNDRWTDSSGEKKERTEWHRVVVWSKQAEIAGEYLRKGRQVYVEGSLRTREWTDRDGNKRYTTEVHALNFQMLGSRADADGDAGDGPGSREPAGSAVSESDEGYGEDDIPF